jgi:hypothetical protein
MHFLHVLSPLSSQYASSNKFYEQNFVANFPFSRVRIGLEVTLNSGQVGTGVLNAFCLFFLMSECTVCAAFMFVFQLFPDFFLLAPRAVWLGRRRVPRIACKCFLIINRMSQLDCRSKAFTYRNQYFAGKTESKL